MHFPDSSLAARPGTTGAAAARRRRLFGGGTAGNEQLTAMVGVVLLALLAVHRR